MNTEEPILEERFVWRSSWFYLWIAALIVAGILLSGCSTDPYRAVAQLHVNDGLYGVEGSGTLIWSNGFQGVILSCRHVNEKEGNLVTCKWLNAEEQVTGGIVIDVMEGDDFTTDLALVLCWLPENVDPVEVGEFDPAGGPLVSVGWRNGDFYESVAYDAHKNGELINTNQPFIGGMSGGPTFQDGRLIGVAVGSNRVDYSITVDGENLKSIIDRIP